MRTFVLSVILFLLLTAQLQGQDSISPAKTRYAVELNHFITGSGFASGSELYVTVMPDYRRTLSIGFYISPDRGKSAGITFHHQVILTRYPGVRRVSPSAFYNLIYRFTRTGEKIPDDIHDVQYGLYKSMEHHIGIELNVKVARDFYIKAAMGFGVYLGSIMKPLDPDPLSGEIAGSSGFGAIAKIGMAWVL